mmetsp:Transcript_25463/g.53232  ORF Transcript_25463/g.53232 Transcript_25463/m.53232 type:complete len:302 (+) Transcript_25463:217-1122(+)
MPRLLTPRKVDSFTRKTSNSSLRGSKNSLSSFGSAPPSSRQTSFVSSSKNYSKGSQLSFASKNYVKSKGSQFSLTRKRSSIAQSSTNSLRRQKSSRQNSLLSYTQQEEPSTKNDEWNFTQLQQKPLRPQQNALWNIVHNKQGSAALSSQGPPSLISSDGSVLTEFSSQASLQSPGSRSPPTSLHATGDTARNDLLQRIALHQASLQHSTNPRVVSPADPALARVPMQPLQHPTILHPTNSLQRSRTRNSSFFPPSQIKEEDPWGHFVETAEDLEEYAPNPSLLSVTRRYPASFSHMSSAHQ